MIPSTRRFLPAALGSVLLAGLLAAPVSAGSGHTLYVDDDTKVGPTGCNGSSITRTGIQEALDDASPGDTVKVCPGTYNGFFTLAKNGVTLTAVDPYTAVVSAPTLITSGSGPLTGALILVNGADRVTISGLKLVAPAPEAAPTGFGCHVPAMIAAIGNADAVKVLKNRIVTDGPDTLGNCGYQDGIVFQGGSSGRAAGNIVTNFEGFGIVARGKGTSLVTTGNTIRFWHKDEAYVNDPLAGGGDFGCTYGAGIIYVNKAIGSITDNSIPGLASAGYTTPLICPGIYLEGAGPDIKVLRNAVSNAFDAINTAGTNDWVVKGNRFLDSRHDGVVVAGSRRGVAESNTVRRSLGIGILVDAPSMTPISATAAGYGSLVPAGDNLPIAANNTFRQNVSTDNTGRDCVDRTTGSKTKGTANTWVGNQGDGNDRPSGICPG